MKIDRCYLGDCRDSMRDMLASGGAGKVQCIVTSPPYWGLRDYGADGQIGLEPTLTEFLAHLVEVFDLARDLLADDGTLWLNMGDSYASRGGPTGPQTGSQFINRVRGKAAICLSNRNAGRDEGFKPKDLIGQPWRLAFALQDAGSRPGDVVFDPFLGSGTTAQVAQRLGRRWVGCELNPDYLELQRDRTRQMGLMLGSA